MRKSGLEGRTTPSLAPTSTCGSIIQVRLLTVSAYPLRPRTTAFLSAIPGVPADRLRRAFRNRLSSSLSTGPSGSTASIDVTGSRVSKRPSTVSSWSTAIALDGSGSSIPRLKADRQRWQPSTQSQPLSRSRAVLYTSFRPCGGLTRSFR